MIGPVAIFMGALAVTDAAAASDVAEFDKALEGTPCVIVGHPIAGGIYDARGNCIVPFHFTRPDGGIYDGAYIGPSWEQRKQMYDYWHSKR